MKNIWSFIKLYWIFILIVILQIANNLQQGYVKSVEHADEIHSEASMLFVQALHWLTHRTKCLSVYLRTLLYTDKHIIYLAIIPDFTAGCFITKTTAILWPCFQDDQGEPVPQKTHQLLIFSVGCWNSLALPLTAWLPHEWKVWNTAGVCHMIEINSQLL